MTVFDRHCMCAECTAARRAGEIFGALHFAWACEGAEPIAAIERAIVIVTRARLPGAGRRRHVGGRSGELGSPVAANLALQRYGEILSDDNR